ncbi:MAG TPA: nitrogen fixation protein NifZ [Rhodospirillaceae bacterium]|nr:nitrogen fixation protein NifZ [Rhodospirillaceae bacterium]
MSEQAVELWGPPCFDQGDKVVAEREVRNDGTFPGVAMGVVLIRKGEVGYVHSIGTYLNRYYIYGVEFLGHPRLVGMRAGELSLMQSAPPPPPGRLS